MLFRSEKNGVVLFLLKIWLDFLTAQIVCLYSDSLIECLMFIQSCVQICRLKIWMFVFFYDFDKFVFWSYLRHLNFFLNFHRNRIFVINWTICDSICHRFKIVLKWCFTFFFLIFLITLVNAYTIEFFYSIRIVKINLKKKIASLFIDFFYHKYLQFKLTVTLLIFMILWTVKTIFLTFYRLFFEVFSIFIRLWWIITDFIFVFFWICIDNTLTICGFVKDLYDFNAWPIFQF